MHTKKTNANRTSTSILRCLAPVLFLTASITLTTGCQQQQSREFDAWKWKWPVWTTKPAQSSTTQTSPANAPSAPTPIISNSFTIRILESTGSDLQLNEAWSYLDEAAPISGDWQMLHRNGLRCGVGQFSDWPTVRQQFEKCGTRVKTELQVSLGSFAPMNILTDPMKSERTIFYYDRDGRTHGRDFGPSSMQFTMTMAGRMAGGRVRTIFTPRILRPTSSLEQFVGKENRKSMTEQELENFGIVVDLGPEEFAILGPAGGQMPASLVGSQLFSSWSQGQRRSTFILISAVQLEPGKK
jgi:hypothetical protein